MGFLSKVQAAFIDGTNQMVLLTSVSFLDTKSGFRYHLPEGFISDGASIPRFFWRWVGHPFEESHRNESILHDYLCKYGQRLLVSRLEADGIFRRALIEHGDKSRFQCWLFWVGVRLGAMLGVGVPKGDKP